MIPKELLKGTLKPIVLKLLTENERMYGYDITKQVETITAGKIKLTYGALYPVLHKLVIEGTLITEQEIVNNRTRVYYKLTPKGNSHAIEKIKEMEEYVETLKNILKPNIGLEPCV